MRAAPDGCRRLGGARVGSQLPRAFSCLAESIGEWLPIISHIMAIAIKRENALNCLTKKVVIIDAPRGSTSSSTEESLGFWIDDVAKTVVLVDGTPLTVRRFDDRWISATRGDVSYELDRQNGNLAYASSTTKDGTVTIIIGSGRCNIAAGPAG